LVTKFKTIPVEEPSLIELWPTDIFIWYGLTWFFISGLIGLMAFPFLMSVIGFGFDGVSPYSCASCTQRRVYGDKTGFCILKKIKKKTLFLDGCFSKFQSLGTQPRRLMIIGFFLGAIVGEVIAMIIYFYRCCTINMHFLPVQNRFRD